MSWIVAIVATALAPGVTMRPLLPPSNDVKVCQVGYLPSEPKFAVVTAEPTGEARVRRAADGRTVATLPIGPERTDADTGDKVRWVNFGRVRAEGDYVLEVDGVGTSFPFRIAKDAFARAFRLGMRSFYGQRCGIAVDLAPDFPEYRYDACHLEPAVYHASSGREGTRDASKGWHDAGDYGKYVVNSGITTGTLLWAYELNARKLGKIGLDLPESGGKLPDFLAEVKWNLDWMLTMQDVDGGVWHKCTTAQFPGFVMPAKDPTPMLIIGSGKEPFKTTHATANLVAVAAIAARVYRPFDRAYADRCRRAAELGWIWLRDNPDTGAFRNPPGIATGGYGEPNASDERLWAAAELFRTTGNAEYDRAFLAAYRNWTPTISPTAAQNWGDVRNLGMFAYAMSAPARANPEAVARIKADTKKAAQAIVERTLANGYRNPLPGDQYVWGSNAVVANFAIMLQMANRFEKNDAARFAALDALHFLLGRNPYNTSFVTHVGTKSAMRPHHRPSAADGVDAPWPGLLVGGPNANRRTPPGKPWVDDQSNFTQNENAINWNAALVFVLAEALP
ncbi:MAG: glycoside hydrolase family 9 protein [Fimbriimonadaceae bacterium]|nr:glycoside hydrolase family 9 protein [Fimbriimonadaceae bacterium]